MIGPALQPLGPILGRIVTSKVILEILKQAAKNPTARKILIKIGKIGKPIGDEIWKILIQKHLGNRQPKIDKKLKKLQNLLDEKKITADEYSEAKKVALSEFARG